METQKKFQNKRLNKEDHKRVDQAAGGLRKGATAAGVVGAVGLAIYKFGPKKALDLAKTVVKSVAQSIAKK